MYYLDLYDMYAWPQVWWGQIWEALHDLSEGPKLTPRGGHDGSQLEHCSASSQTVGSSVGLRRGKRNATEFVS